MGSIRAGWEGREWFYKPITHGICAKSHMLPAGQRAPGCLHSKSLAWSSLTSRSQHGGVILSHVSGQTGPGARPGIPPEHLPSVFRIPLSHPGDGTARPLRAICDLGASSTLVIRLPSFGFYHGGNRLSLGRWHSKSWEAGTQFPCSSCCFSGLGTRAARARRDG